MSDVKHNAMGPVRPVDDEGKAVFHEIKREVVDHVKSLKHNDHVHNLHLVDDLTLIESFRLVEYATEVVAYGTNYFGKINLGDEKYIHVRAHKSNDGTVEFYSIYTEGTAIWDRDTPLEYFID